jgi:hypothetical protein
MTDIKELKQQVESAIENNTTNQGLTYLKLRLRLTVANLELMEKLIAVLDIHQQKNSATTPMPFDLMTADEKKDLNWLRSNCHPDDLSIRLFNGLKAYVHTYGREEMQKKLPCWPNIRNCDLILFDAEELIKNRGFGLWCYNKLQKMQDFVTSIITKINYNEK